MFEGEIHMKRKIMMWSVLVCLGLMPGSICKADQNVEVNVDMGMTDLEDGSYQMEVVLQGGSGRAGIQSPAEIQVLDGCMTARIIWSSKNYDYMILDGQKYEPVNTEGNSAFDIPVIKLDEAFSVIADTVAMSTPHEIEYTLCFDSGTLSTVQSAENADQTADEGSDLTDTIDQTNEEMENTAVQTDKGLQVSQEDWCGLAWDHEMPLSYAEQFAVNYYEGGYARISIADSAEYLVVPEDMPVPETVGEEVVVLQKPLDRSYLVATSAMDLICSLNAQDHIALSGTKADGWYVPSARSAMEEGKIMYAGKYSAPDYELILAGNCNLAIESTMIYHSPDVKEKLESFGIPVLVEYSSYETHPMGRTEWLKLYGVLYDKEEEADTVFETQLAKMKAVSELESTGKTAAFFYISTSGYANVRKSNDYVAQMINLAGGQYAFDQVTAENNLSTVNLSMEEFFVSAKDADFIIYNSSIDAELSSMNDLLSKSELLAQFKAVREGNVWCTGKNLFQETTCLGDMIEELHLIFAGEAEDELQFFHKLK